ncbi:hypothetical protein [Nocardia callitridis]|uniref:Uncharacterized protein n=1 Tax=Nocardia callitridis TaxID=648753 RepID=A0ABP9JST3_9NOCA
MRRSLARVAFPVAAVAALAVGLAAPAQAANTEFAVTTLTSGPCVIQQTVRVGYADPNYPGAVSFALPQPNLTLGIPINCGATITVRWHNETTGASGAHSTTVNLPSGCDVPICSAYSVPTGPGRVTAELSSNFIHQQGEITIDVP